MDRICQLIVVSLRKYVRPTGKILAKDCCNLKQVCLSIERYNAAEWRIKGSVI